MWIEIEKQIAWAKKIRVTPFAGVWIEILKAEHLMAGLVVTPFAGVWIQICPIIKSL